MVRLGVIGTGWITDAFLEGMRTAPGLRLTAVCSRRPETGQAYAAKWGAQETFTDPGDMARSGAVDAVYIASPNDCHVPQSRLFLENGRHVLCEKPLAADPREVEALSALARKNGLVYMEAIMMLHMPQLSILENAVKRLGRLSIAHFDFCQYSSKYPAYLAGQTPNIFNPERETGALMDLGVYCVYPAVYLFGEPESVAASASFLRTGADGAGCALLRYPGFQVVLTYSKTGQGAAPSEIVGDEGCLTIGSISKLEELVLTENGKEVRLWGGEEKAVLMGHEAARFYEAITRPQETAPRLEREAALYAAVHRCMREIRRQAGIVFPGEMD